MEISHEFAVVVGVVLGVIGFLISLAIDKFLENKGEA